MDIKLILPYTQQTNTQLVEEGSMAKIREGTKGNKWYKVKTC
jgi:hypothetical protein